MAWKSKGRRAAVWAGAVIIALALLNSGARRASCAYYGWQLDRETRYVAFVGCTVHTTYNGWVPRNELRVNP